MILLFAYAVVRPCQSQERNCMAGIDLTSFLRRSATVNVYYGFSRHWSAAFEASISYNGISRKKSDTELEHSGEFSHSTSVGPDRDHHAERLLFSWWPSQTLQGFSLSAGIQSGSHSGFDILTEAGYTIGIWKGLCISAGIRIPLLEGIRERNINARSIKAGIHYRF